MGHKLKLELHLFWLLLLTWCCYPLFLFAFTSVLLFVCCCSPLHVWCCFFFAWLCSSFLCIHCIFPIHLLVLSSSHVVLFPSSHNVAFLFARCYFPFHEHNAILFFMCYSCFLCTHYYCPFYMCYCFFFCTWCCSSFRVLLLLSSSLATILLFMHIVALLFALKYKVFHYCSSLHLQLFSFSHAIVLFLVCYYFPFHAIAPMLLFVKKACTTPFHSFLQVGNKWELIT